MMIKMPSHLGVPVSPSRDMEITLHLVQLQAPVYTATIWLPTTPYSRGLAPPRLLPSQCDDIMDMLLPEALVVSS